ncbi:MAG TPA: tRNA (adenosine(37)-N6)-threonylcarbamoyltransferase complex transferase subunit TsaD [Candidatus Bathyarchaeia archaeon]|nr:tRNA (adenosine(37)-N6)-threonylcarbamoyltransferase complex transferase subunit TsaD [Candidatus Bathyarchaeia archaeon]
MNGHTSSYYILGIETSCDETGIAVYHTQRGIISQALYSQIDLHALYGGVIPEIASRTQLEKIGPLCTYALQQGSISLDDIDVIAVTNKPGLPGSLLVGVCFAKAVAWAKKKPIIGVNHLEGHIFSSFLEHDVPFPHLCLTASGGHTSLYLVRDFGIFDLIGQTSDDAAGELFDKIAKLMHLPYPGGPVMEKAARTVQFQDFFQYPRATAATLDFSFSGLKTAVLYDLVKRHAYDLKQKTFLKKNDTHFIAQVASSLHVCVADIFEQKLTDAYALFPEIKAVTFVGGVACNAYISSRLQEWASRRQCAFFSPSAKYCTDNGAMIAFVAGYKALRGHFDSFDMDILR